MDFCNKVTIVIPTYNRPKELLRLITYYKKSNTNINLLVLDSSSTDNKKNNIDSVKNLTDNFKYKEYPKEIKTVDKIDDGLKWVNTEFIVLCADDDVVFLDGLFEAVTYLESNLDYACAGGDYLGFSISEDKLSIDLEHFRAGINDDSPILRIFYLMQSYESLFYSVIRREYINKVFAANKKIDNLHFQELFQANSTLLMGKSHRISRIFGARQHGVPADPMRDKWQTYDWFYENPSEFMEAYLKYRDELYLFYFNEVSGPTVSKFDFFRAIDICQAMFFSANCRPSDCFNSLKNLWPDVNFRTNNNIALFKNTFLNKLFLINDFMKSLISKILLRSRIPISLKRSGYDKDTYSIGLNSLMDYLQRGIK